MRLCNDSDFVNSIISAINERKLVIFIGAGFSKLCSLPLWNDLANRLIDACINDEDIELNYADKSLITKDKILCHKNSRFEKLWPFFKFFSLFCVILIKKVSESTN